MKKKFLFLSITALLSLYVTAQEPKRSEKMDSINEIINKNTKGVRFTLNTVNVNSELSEIGTSFFKNKFIILSNKKRRHYETTMNEETKTPNNNLYCVNVDSTGNLSFPLLFSSAIDSKDNEGTIAFSPDENSVFFTQTSKDKPNVYKLYKATLDVNSEKYWTNITELKLMDDQYSIETPFVSNDGKKLFFSSNIPGGYGGFDLYEVAILENGDLGTPMNLGSKINTKEDEKFPFVSDDNKYLFFSSKGHTNLGGYDVFRSSISEDGYQTAFNLGNTLNSRKDEVAFVVVNDSKGYVSSDKTATDGNFDIFRYNLKMAPNTVSKLLTVEKTSGIPLPNTKVTIKNEFGKVLADGKTDANGNISVIYNPLTIYNVEVEKEGYEPFTKQMISGDFFNDSKIELNQKKAIVTTTEIKIEPIYFDFNKATIKAESTLSLNKIVDVLNANKEMSISIFAHTDNKGSDEYNKTLSEKRAKSTYDYLVKKGINKNRLKFIGMGETQPLVNCTTCTAEEDQLNRRTEFKINKP
ncbi:Probable outer membrane protein precursor, OmpA family [Flavobacterium indicum GPTSA100-9 = DSM 17447]|uniref:Probable outer membrane protein, OmpA family n=1 Tax=Flavobacterium indicum (strain DSM 17447 / CIP 109464 / GPTSA100-9) TaxID=1094466 RepID=H8XQ92_FLAIG|nr:OmpA family protein [Flavobacterium indicum]CCG52386.1 Probable outer membrane protein precursor, OmpA family [Flavobacterium indicum GPTSA100-9 = DSM 17447]